MNFYGKDVKKKMGAPFWPIALWFQIKIDEEDVDYIANVIRKDKCFSLVWHAYTKAHTSLEYANAYMTNIVFFDKFYNDVHCPKGAKLVLFTILGLDRDYMEQNFPNLLAQRYKYIERWLETVSQSE